MPMSVSQGVRHKEVSGKEAGSSEQHVERQQACYRVQEVTNAAEASFPAWVGRDSERFPAFDTLGVPHSHG